MTLDESGVPWESPYSAAVEIHELRVVLGDQTVLRGLDLAVGRGTRLALVGPNGAGKSTLLRVVAGLLRPSRGSVQIDGRSISSEPWRARRVVGLVGHQPMLHPELTARENLRFYARLYGLDQVDGRVEAGLQRVGLADRSDRRVDTLSRGTVQRLALARALLHEPLVLLLDEAETGLDTRAHELLLAAIEDAVGSRTVILASHDLRFVHQVADHVAVLDQGRIVGTMVTAGLGEAGLAARYAEALAPRPGAPARRAAVRGG
jgi:heme exporter protein A